MSGRALTATIFLFVSLLACAKSANAATTTRVEGRFVAVDIDRDGDLDVISATGGRLTVWINDGQGHLTSQRPSNGPAIDIHAPGTTFRGGAERTDPTTDDGAPSTALLILRAHAPPSLAAGDAASAILFVYSSTQLRSSSPRAPPRSL